MASTTIHVLAAAIIVPALARHAHTGSEGEPKMAQYLISVWHDDDYSDNDWSDAEIQRLGAQVGAVNEVMQRTGVRLYGNGLQPQTTATVLPPADGEASMTDGPSAAREGQMSAEETRGGKQARRTLQTR